MEKFPEFRFVSTSRTKGGESVIAGDLTLHGVTRPVIFTLEQGYRSRIRGAISASPPPRPRQVEPQGVGPRWNQVLELGGVAVSDEVKFSLEVQLTGAQAKAA